MPTRTHLTQWESMDPTKPLHSSARSSSNSVLSMDSYTASCQGASGTERRQSLADPE